MVIAVLTAQAVRSAGDALARCADVVVYCLQSTCCMLSAILHVEDDSSLRALVDLSFEGFGFRGKTVAADSVAAAIEELDAATADGRIFDLIICDMNLPDGSGLDVVRYARRSTTWKFTPILILSSDANPMGVGRAYALGANAYVDKSAHGRTLIDVLRSLYDHWAKDVIHPQTLPPDRVHRYIEQTMRIRGRYARLYEKWAGMFKNDPSESAFWLTRSLGESNVINLLRFLQAQLEERLIPDRVIDTFEQLQNADQEVLTRAEQAVDSGNIKSRDDAYRQLLDIMTSAHVDLVSRAVSYLFPSMPMAMDALRDYFLGEVQTVAAWVELHSTDSTLRQLSERLRGETARHIPATAPAIIRL